MRVTDLIYDADFAAADAALPAACGPAPAQACAVLDMVGQWWRLYLDVDNRSGDGPFTARLTTLLNDGERWVKQEPDRAEAWLYLGAAYGIRVQFSAQRSEYLAAARDGKRINQSLERALALDPDLADAHAGLGLYRYYADIAPSILKFLRWFLGLPGGDRAKGLAELQRARTSGVLLKAEAAYQLHFIDLWYERKTDEALAILADLRARYPHNPIFLLNAAQAHEVYRSDRAAALDVYRALIDGARNGSLREPRPRGDVGTPRRRRRSSTPSPNPIGRPTRRARSSRGGRRCRMARWRTRSSSWAARSIRSARAIRRSRRTARPSRRRPPVIRAGAPRRPAGAVADARSRHRRRHAPVARGLARVRTGRRRGRARAARPRRRS